MRSLKINNKSRYIGSLLSAMMLFLFSSCINDDLQECPKTGDDMIRVSFKMLAYDPSATRADDSGHNEVSGEYSEFEERIDLSDAVLFLFAKKEADGGSEALLLKSVGFQSVDGNGVSVFGTAGDYTVSLEMSKEKLNNLLGITTLLNDHDRISFRLLIIAHATPADMNLTDFWDEISGDDFDSVVSAIEAKGMDMSVVYDGTTDSNNLQSLYSSKKAHIPMSGSAVFPISYGALYGSRPFDWVYLGEVDMLRSLAKVRVVDNIAEKNEEGYPKIIKAEFVGSEKVSKMLPYDIKNYKNGSQIHTPNLVAGEDDDSDYEGCSFKLGVVPDLWNMTPSTSRKGLTYLGYVPEQKIGKEDEQGNKRPMLKITVALQKNSDGSDHTVDYEVSLTSYLNTDFSYGENILRNHIYTLAITGIKDTGLDAMVRVAPWEYHRTHIEI